LSNGDAQVLGEGIARILIQKDIANPEDIVDEAADPKSPLHRYFMWDDRQAGHQYRLEQARYYLRVIVIEREDVSAPVRAFQNVTVVRPSETADEDEVVQKWVTLDQALADPEAWRSVCEQELRRLRQCEHNLSLYQELVPMALPPLRESISALQATLMPVTA